MIDSKKRLKIRPNAHALLNAMIKKGFTPQTFAEKIGLNKATVYRLLSGQSGYGYSSLHKICEVLDVEPWEIAEGFKPPESHIRKSANKAPPKDLPLISWVQAGEFNGITDIFQPGDADEWVPRLGIRDPNAFCLRVRGNSMAPKFEEGDIIVVSPNRRPENGDYVIAKLIDSQEATLKQFYADDTYVILKPFNRAYEDIVITGKDLEQLRIVGVVVKAIKDLG